MKRLGVTNKNILAKFVGLANATKLPVYLESASKLARDNNFPKMTTLVDKDYSGDFFVIEKRNGLWQVQKIDAELGKVTGITPWLPTKKMDDALDFTMAFIAVLKERDQVLA